MDIRGFIVHSKSVKVLLIFVESSAMLLKEYRVCMPISVEEVSRSTCVIAQPLSRMC